MKNKETRKAVKNAKSALGVVYVISNLYINALAKNKNTEKIKSTALQLKVGLEEYSEAISELVDVTKCDK